VHLSLDKIGAIFTIVGSVMFLGAAFFGTPRVYMESSPAEKLEIISASPGTWIAAQILFGLGAVSAAGGLATAVIALRGQAGGWIVYASVALLVIGAMAWSQHLYARMQDPTAFAMGALSTLPLLIYFVLTPIGFAGLGLVLVSSSLPDWVGWMLIAGMALFLIVTVVTRDMVPLVYYLPTLVAGVMIYVRAP
jgi:hypothetical protein